MRKRHEIILETLLQHDPDYGDGLLCRRLRFDRHAVPRFLGAGGLGAVRGKRPSALRTGPGADLQSPVQPPGTGKGCRRHQHLHQPGSPGLPAQRRKGRDSGRQRRTADGKRHTIQRTAHRAEGVDNRDPAGRTHRPPRRQSPGSGGWDPLLGKLPGSQRNIRQPF